MWRSRIGDGPSASLIAGGCSKFTKGWTHSRGALVPSPAPSKHYHWSINQAEYASDIVLRRQAELGAIYENLTRSAIHAVKPDNIAIFLGRQLHGNYQGEMGNRFHMRIEATRLKHTLGAVSLKLYDKFGLILRLETTVNDVSFFKLYREVEHRNGIREKKWEPRRKSSYSLPALRELLAAANRRYLEFLAALEDPRAGVAKRALKNAEPALVTEQKLTDGKDDIRLTKKGTAVLRLMRAVVEAELNTRLQILAEEDREALKMHFQREGEKEKSERGAIKSRRRKARKEDLEEAV